MDDAPGYFPFPPPPLCHTQDGVEYLLIGIEVDNAHWVTYISEQTVRAWWAQTDLRPYIFSIGENTDISREDFVLSRFPDPDALLEQGQDIINHSKNTNGLQERESIMAQFRAQILTFFIIEKDEITRATRRAKIKRRHRKDALPFRSSTLPVISSFFSGPCQRFSNLSPIPGNDNQVVTTNETQETERQATSSNETALDHKQLRAFLISKGVGAYNRKFVSRCIDLVDKMDDICSLCHENDKILCMTTCFHFMCEECWRTLVKYMTEEAIRCPYCRTPFHEAFRYSESPHQRRVPNAWMERKREGMTELLGRVPVKAPLDDRRLPSNLLRLNVPRWDSHFATLQCTPKMVEFFRNLKDEYSKTQL